MTPLRRDRPGPFIGRARHHDSVVALQPDLLVELMTPLRRDRPGPLVRVCRAGAAERAYPRRERLARSRAAEPPDLASRARAPAMAGFVHAIFFNLWKV